MMKNGVSVCSVFSVAGMFFEHFTHVLSLRDMYASAWKKTGAKNTEKNGEEKWAERERGTSS